MQTHDTHNKNSLLTPPGKDGQFLLTIICCLILCFFLSLAQTAADTTVQQDACGKPVVQAPQGCTTCHGFPLAASIHPPLTQCYTCHGQVVDDTLGFINPALHNNGIVEYSVGCSSCHGGIHDNAPPQNLKGECSEGGQGTGAHKAMRRNEIAVHRVGCSNCHRVPLTTWSDGHIDGDGKAEVVFSQLAVARGAHPVWDGSTCTNVYCHGATLAGGDHKNPSWRDTSGAAAHCGACHRLSDPQGNTQADCSACHPGTVTKDRAILPFGDHLNGVIDTSTTTEVRK